MKRTRIKRKPYKQNIKLDQALCERAGGEWLIELRGNATYTVQRCIATCETCHTYGDFRGLSRSHIIAKSRGGKDGLHNEILECYPCHDLYEKKPETRPKDSLGYKLYLEQIK